MKKILASLVLCFACSAFAESSKPVFYTGGNLVTVTGSGATTNLLAINLGNGTNSPYAAVSGIASNVTPSQSNAFYWAGGTVYAATTATYAAWSENSSNAVALSNSFVSATNYILPTLTVLTNLTNSVLWLDGQKPMSGTLNMGQQSITNAGDIFRRGYGYIGFTNVSSDGRVLGMLTEQNGIGSNLELRGDPDTIESTIELWIGSKLHTFNDAGLTVQGTIYANTGIWVDNHPVLTNLPANAVTTNFAGIANWENATIRVRDAIETNEPVNLHQLGLALGSVAVLYASTNKNLEVEDFYDARTFLPTHTQSVIKVSGITNGQYLASWISNTGLVSVIRRGIAEINSKQRITATTGGKFAWTKAEIYKWIGTNNYPELFENSQSNNLTATFIDYDNEVDCQTNVMFDATNRVLVRWKCINQNNNPDWEFVCGTGMVVAVRLPVANPIDVQAKVYAGTGIASIVSTPTGSVINAQLSTAGGWNILGTNTFSGSGVTFSSNLVVGGSITGNVYYGNGASLTNMPKEILSLSLFGINGAVASQAYLPGWSVAMSDTDGGFHGGFLIQTSGTYRLTMVWQHDGANSGKTMGGNLSMGVVGSGNQISWNAFNATAWNMTLDVNPQCVHTNEYPADIGLSAGQIVGCQYIKTDNAGGAVGSFFVHGFILTRKQ